MSDPNVKILLTLDDKASGGLQASVGAIDKVGQSAQQAARGADSLAEAIKRVGHYGAGLAGFGGFGTLAASAGKAADAYTNLASRLQLVSTTTADLNRNLADTFGIAQRTRQSWEGVADLYGKLARVTGDLGLSHQQLAGVVETVNQAVLVSGGSAQSTQAALVQLGQGLASGTLRGEELNSVMEQTPRLAQALADGLGVGIGQLRAMGEAGELTGDRVVGALQKAAQSVAGDFGKMAPTIAGAWQQISNAALQYVGAADKASGASSGIASVMASVAGNFGTFATAVEATTVALGVLAGGRIVATIAAKRQLAAETLKAALAEQSAAAAAVRTAEAQLILTTSTNTLTAAKQRLAAANVAVASTSAVSAIAALGGPVGAAIIGVTALAGVLSVVALNADKAGDAVKSSFSTEADAVVASLQKQIDKIKERNKLAGMGVDAGDSVSELAADTARKNAAAQAELTALQSSFSPYAHAKRIAELNRQIGENNGKLADAIAKQRELNAAQDQFGKGDPTKSLGEYYAKFGSQVESVRAKVVELNAATVKAFNHAKSLPEADRSAEMQRIAASHEKRLAEMQQKLGADDAAAAKRAAAEAAQVLKEQYANRIKVVGSALEHEQALVKQAVLAGTVTEKEALDARYQLEVTALGKRAALLQQQLDATTDASDRMKLTGDLEEVQAAAVKASDAWQEGHLKMRQSSDQFLDAQNKESAGLQEMVKRAQEELDAIGKSAASKDELTAKAKEAAAAEHELAAAAYERGRAYAEANNDTASTAFYERARDAALAQAKALREVANLERQQGAKRVAVDQADAAKKAWEDYSRDIERSLTDALMRSFESGDSFGEAFAKNLKNTFKSMVLKVAVQAIVSPVMSGAQSLLGLPGSASSGMNLLSAGNSIYGMLSGNTLNTLAGSPFGGALGLSAAGLSMASVGGATGVMAGGAFYPGAIGAMQGSAAVGSLSGVGGALGSIGTALPYLGAALAVGSMLGLFEGDGPAERTSTYNRRLGADVAVTNNPDGGASYEWKNNRWFSADMSAAQDAYTAQMVAGEQNLIRALDLTETQMAAIDTAFAGLADRVYNFGTEGTDWLASMADEQILADRVQAMADALGMSVDEVMAAMNPLFAALKTLGDAVGLTVRDIASLAESMGGIEAATQALSSYYTHYYSEAERTAAATEQISAVLADVGLVIPDTVASFRALVDQQIALGASGTEALSALLSVEGAFFDIATAAEQAAAAAQREAEQEADAAARAQQQAAQAAAQAAAEAAQAAAEAAQAIADYMTDIAASMTSATTELARIDMTDYERAVATLADSEAERIQALRDLGGATDANITAIQALTTAERELLEARNQRAAIGVLAGLQRDIDNLGMTDLARTLTDIARRTDEYITQLRSLGQATDANVAAVARWKAALMQDALESDALRVADAAYNVLSRATQSAIQGIQDGLTDQLAGIDDQKASISEIVTLSDSLVGNLENAIDTLRGVGNEEQSIEAARRQIDAMLEAAWRGTLPDEESLSKALDAVTRDDANRYASREDWLRAQRVQAGKLETLAELVDGQGNTAQQQLDALDDQRQAIEQAARDQIDALNTQLDTAREQLDALRGIDAGVLSVAEAMAALATAIANAQQIQSGQIRNPITAGTAVDQLYNSILGRAADSGGRAYWAGQLTSGNASVSDVASALQAAAPINSAVMGAYRDVAGKTGSAIDEEGLTYWTGRAYEVGVEQMRDEFEWAVSNIRGYAVGTNYVPRDQLAMLHEGEAVVPAPFNPSVFGNVIDITPLIEEVKALRAELRAGQGSIASNTRQSKELLDSVINGGNTLRTEAA